MLFTALHRAQADAKRRRDLWFGHVFEVPEHDRGTHSLREPVERPPDDLGHIAFPRVVGYRLIRRFIGREFLEPARGLPATIVRTGTALLFLIAVGALNEIRQRRPDSGCGCFGELSGTPIGLRTITRLCLLCASAVATLGLPGLHKPSSSAEAELWLAVLAFELALIAFLSPELGEIMVRLGYSEPCELRRLPVGRTMTALHASSVWRKYAGQISATTPSDVWRKGCWRFVVYPGLARGRRVNIVFAVYLESRRPAIRTAVLDADTDEVLGPAGTRESAFI